MMDALYMPAYAKVNLSLDVCGLRADGYHLLRSVFQEISLCDDVFLSPADEISIVCDAPFMPPLEKNIIYKVARAFFDYTNRDGGAAFTLVKRIPSGAGLGGGSADGVAALKLLDRLYQTALTPEEMVQIVAPIGADLPFFVYGGTALCEGVGERVTPLSSLKTGAFLLVKPDIFMSTPEIFGVLDRTEATVHPNVDGMVAAVQRQDITAIGTLMGNSLQSAVETLGDFVPTLRAKLLASGALGAVLSGSGSTVYGIFEDEAAALSAAGQFDETKFFVSSARPV